MIMTPPLIHLMAGRGRALAVQVKTALSCLTVVVEVGGTVMLGATGENLCGDNEKNCGSFSVIMHPCPS